MKLKMLLLGAAAAATFGTVPAQAVTYTYVGSWVPYDGPDWPYNPLAYSGRGAAALLFGGAPSDYVISTVDGLAANINFMAHYDVIGIGPRDFADDYFRGTEGTTHYQDVFTFDPSTDTVSAYVHDNFALGVNYSFRIDATGAVPEPATWGLMLVGFGGIGYAMRRNRKVAVSFG